MALTKVTFSMISGAAVNVLDYIPKTEHAAIINGTSTYDCYSAIQAAINVALQGYVRTIGSSGGSFPAIQTCVKFPSGVYNTSQTIEVNSNYASCVIEGIGNACIQYTGGAGSCVIVYDNDPTIGIITTAVTIRNLMIRKADKLAGTVGMTVLRVSNCLFEGLSFYGFDYAIQNLGGISNIYDFKNRAIEYCNVGMLIEQSTSPSPSNAIVKPNLVVIKNGIFINTSNVSVLIRRNPDESLTNNGSGGVISIEDTNFQGGGNFGISAEWLGEVPSAGVLSIDRCWFEGSGTISISLQKGTISMNNCFIVQSPILLYDTAAYLDLNYVRAYFSATPTANALISRYDTTTNGLNQQVNSRGCLINQDGISTVYLTAGNTAKNTQLIANYLQSDLFQTQSGNTGGIAGSGTFDILNLNAGGMWIVMIQQTDSGIVWRGVYTIISSSITVNITTLSQNNITLTNPSAAVVRVTNTSGSTIDLYWSAVRVG